MTARDVARQAHERRYVEVMELDLDRCRLEYGKSYTNLALWSEDFSNAAWLGTALVTADTLTDDDPASWRYRYQIVPAFDVAKAYTWSLKITKDTVGRATRFPMLRLRFQGSTTQDADVMLDTSTGDISSAGTALLGCTVQSDGDHWRVSITGKSVDAANTAAYFWVYPAAGASAAWALSAAATGTITATAAQCVEGSKPGFYVATTDATATKSCTATGAVGSECQHTYRSCQAKASYTKGIHTYRFITRGAPIPAGEALRPYILSVSTMPTVIDLEGGLARSAKVTVRLADETDSDIEQDPYAATRPVPAGGTFWTRLLARNKNYAGRTARVKHGYPFELSSGATYWLTFQTEQYIIETIAGPNARGEFDIVLKDPLKLADSVKVPKPTDGKLAVALPDYADRGTAQGGSINTIILRPEASAADGFFVGMAARLDDQTGAGQERVITGYVGATREATVSPAFSVAPDATTIYSVHHLHAVLAAGKGAQYDIYGYPTWVRFGEEMVRITSRVDDTLKWDTSADRAQFGTPFQEHKQNESAQVCKVYIDQAYTDVIIDQLNEAGLDNSVINTALLADQDSTWLGADYRITVPLHTPESVSKYLKELAQEANSVLWWSPTHQLVNFRVIVPQGASEPPHLTDEASFIDGTVEVRALDELRLTAVAVNYGLRNATANREEAKNYLGGEIYIDAAAESPNEYDGERTKVVYSRWFSSGNSQAARDLGSRTADYLRDAPSLLKGGIDPKDFNFHAGDQVDVTVGGFVDATTGHPKKVRLIVTKIEDRGRDIAIEGRTTNFAKWYGFIAHNGVPDYPDDTDYAHISENTGLMPDGAAGSLII